MFRKLLSKLTNPPDYDVFFLNPFNQDGLRIHLCGLYGDCKAIAHVPPRVNFYVLNLDITVDLPHLTQHTGWRDVDTGEEWVNERQLFPTLTIWDKARKFYRYPRKLEIKRQKIMQEIARKKDEQARSAGND